MANRFDLEAQKKLDKVINSLRLSATRPPVTADDLRAISELRRSLQDTINSLKMEGPVAVFLLDAIQGKGDPKALTNPEIRAYLDGHQVLWQSLRVLLK